MRQAQNARGGVVGEVFLGILAALGAFVTYTLASGGIARGDQTQVAISAIPGVVTLILAGMLMAIVLQGRREKEIAKRRVLNPDEPWLWADEWRDGRIRSTTAWGPAVIFGVFAALWNTGAAVAVFQQTDLSRAVGLGLVVLIGLGLIGVAVYKVLAARKYPPAVLEMSALPGVLGGRLGGSIHVPSQVPAGAEARVKLECERVLRNPGRSGPRGHTLWQSELTLAVPAGGSLPVEFAIPFDLPSSEPPIPSGEDTAGPVSWTLWVTASVPGVDYLARFVVPVFRTGASDPSLVRTRTEPPHTSR